MSMPFMTEAMSAVGKNHPDLVSDEKVRRYILLIVGRGEEAAGGALAAGPG